MNTEPLISLKTLCRHYEVEESFIYILNDFELFSIHNQQEEFFLHQQDLPLLEKMVRLHKELDINPEGLQAVYQLALQIERLQQEVQQLKTKLQIFEAF